VGLVGKASRTSRAGNGAATLENCFAGIDKAERADVRADRAMVIPAKDPSEIDRVHSRFTSYRS
jgi:hypothetical protein